jgi:hypothetical protein
VILKVSLSSVKHGTATAKVMQVIKASGARIREGKQIPMMYPNTSCGPSLRDGDEGITVAKTGVDAKGRLVLYPYVYRVGDGQVTVTSPCIVDDSRKRIHSCTN